MQTHSIQNVWRHVRKLLTLISSLFYVNRVLSNGGRGVGRVVVRSGGLARPNCHRDSGWTTDHATEKCTALGETMDGNIALQFARCDFSLLLLRYELHRRSFVARCLL